MSSLSSSDSSTLIHPGHAEYLAHLIKRQQRWRTPTPSPPPDGAITRELERPRSARTIQTVLEPHQCALGSKCTREIESFNYHKIKAIHLTARARELRLPVRPLDTDHYDYNDLRGLRDTSDYAADLLLEWRHVGLRDVLKEIRSPEFWEAERKYLEYPGCLEQRQKISTSQLLTSISHNASCIELSSHNSPSMQGSAKGCLGSRHESGGELGAANNLLIVDLSSLPAPLRRSYPRTQKPLSPGSATQENSYGSSGYGRELLARHPRLRGMPTAPLRNISNRDWRRERGDMNLGKRKRTEEAGVGDDIAPKKRHLNQASPQSPEKRKRTEEAAMGDEIAPKKRCLDQARPRIPEMRKRPLQTAHIPFLEARKNWERKHRNTSKDLNPLERFEVPDNKASLPASRRLASARSRDKQKCPLSRSLFNLTSRGHQLKVSNSQKTSLSVYRHQRLGVVKAQRSAVASRTRSKSSLEGFDMSQILQA